MKKKRNYKGQLFRSKRPYELKEIAKTLGIHIRTVQGWLDRELKCLDTRKPYLVMGYEIRRFLRLIVQKRKKPLKLGEFFCPRCKEPRKSWPERTFHVLTHRNLGPNQVSVYLKGICSVCGLPLTLFSSERIAEQWFANGYLMERTPREPDLSTTQLSNTTNLTANRAPEAFPRKAPSKKKPPPVSADQIGLFGPSTFKYGKPRIKKVPMILKGIGESSLNTDFPKREKDA